MRYSTAGAPQRAATRGQLRKLSARGLPLALTLLLAACGGNGGGESAPAAQGSMSGTSRLVAGAGPAAQTVLTPVAASASSAERPDLSGMAAIDHNDATRWSSG
ncbi:hypothetical protein LXA47_10595, partial [Massilia sp. P8910]|nr:hypothetical protein [Massilia antarctica]